MGFFELLQTAYLRPVETIIGNDLDAAKAVLEAEDVCAIPTETVYGLAGNAFSDDAVLKIFQVKQRPAFDPLIVHVGAIDRVAELVRDLPPAAIRLMDAFWPGPLTIVLPKATCIPDLVTSGLDTVGIRMPDHKLTLKLLASLRFPLAAPSANPFGYISPTTAMHVRDQLNGLIPYILDGGACRVGVESTIVGFEEGICTVYRLGGLTIEEISDVAGKVQLQVHSGSDPKAPGMLQSHYAPRKNVFFGTVAAHAAQLKGKRVAALVFDAETDSDDAVIREVLSETGNMEEAARNLFAALRRLDNSDAEVIVATPVPDSGLGKAINDRLKRAATTNHS